MDQFGFEVVLAVEQEVDSHTGPEQPADQLFQAALDGLGFGYRATDVFIGVVERVYESGVTQRVLVGEVAVQRHPSDVGRRCDVGNRRLQPARPDELEVGIEDPGAVSLRVCPHRHQTK